MKMIEKFKKLHKKSKWKEQEGGTTSDEIFAYSIHVRVTTFLDLIFSTVSC